MKKKPGTPSKTGQAIKGEWRRLLSIFDGIEEAFYVSDTETYEILFVNNALRKALGKDVVGKICYREFQGLDSPCPFCTNDIIRKIKPKTYRWEHDNPILKKTYSLHDRIIAWPDGRDVRLELAVDITERKRAETALRESELRYREIFDAPAEAIMVQDARTGRILEVNDTMLRMFGYGSKEEAPRLAIGDLSVDRPPFSNQDAVARLRDAAAGKPQQFEWRAKKKDGNEFPIEVSLRLSCIGGENRILAVIRDISRRMEGEETLRRREALLETAGRVARFGGWSAHLNENRVIWSDQVADIHEAPHGFSPAVEEGIKFYAPEWQEKIGRLFAACAKEGIPFDDEFEIITSTGRRVWVRAVGEAVRDESGAIIRVEGAFQDISDLKRAEEQLRTALTEKDTLLRELYHRTKNNMEIIRSMLTLQAAFGGESGIQTFVKDIDRKILAMATAHKKLYQSRDLSRIRLDEYLIELATLLMQGYAGESRRIGLDLKLDPVVVLIDTAIPCGLILNELICNAMKHAFSGGRSGTIRIRLGLAADGQIEFHFSDDGPGLPEGFDPRAQPRLGMKILFEIVENQLMGTIRVEGRKGTSYDIRFPESQKAPRVKG